ncbi:hypothetical protein J6590_034664 [Homalodisca vitripennis]|nr:hypothetical protein J6590_034664 [Homalodisca vitripennis]
MVVETMMLTQGTQCPAPSPSVTRHSSHDAGADSLLTHRRLPLVLSSRTSYIFCHNDNLPQRWIELKGSQDEALQFWPPRSPDITPSASRATWRPGPVVLLQIFGPISPHNNHDRLPNSGISLLLGPACFNIGLSVLPWAVLGCFQLVS